MKKKGIHPEDVVSLTSAASKHIRLAFKDYAPRRCQRAIDAVRAFEDASKSDASLCHVRRALAPLRNLLEGVQDGRDDLTKADLHAIRVRGNDFWNAYRTARRAYMDAVRRRTAAIDNVARADAEDASQNDRLSALERVNQLRERKQALAKSGDNEVIMRQVKEQIRSAEDTVVIERYSDIAHHLPRQTEDFVLVQAPVLTIFDYTPGLNTAFLYASIQTDRIADYWILRDQTLLGFNPPVAESDQGSVNADYVQECLSSINKAHGVDFVSFTQSLVAHPDKEANILFAWIIPSPKLSTMLERKIKLRGWGFPTHM